MITHKRLLICILLTSFFTFSCEKRSLLPDSLDEIEYFCPTGEVESYFLGWIEEKGVCFKEGINHYRLEAGVASSFTTDGPTATVGDGQEAQNNYSSRGNVLLISRKVFPKGTLFPDFKPSISIQTPNPKDTTGDWNTKKFFETYFSQEGQLTLGTPSERGYNILFTYSARGTSKYFTSNAGAQDGSYLELSKCKITPLPSGDKLYELTFDFSCKLYYHTSRKDSGYPDKIYYTTIENGTFVAKVVI